MAAQTLMHLGMMSNPLTNETTTDLPNAKYSIDLLAVLEEKTKGNLSEDEERYLQGALADLRMHYVRVASAPAADGSKTEDAESPPSDDTADSRGSGSGEA